MEKEGHSSLLVRRDDLFLDRRDKNVSLDDACRIDSARLHSLRSIRQGPIDGSSRRRLCRLHSLWSFRQGQAPNQKSKSGVTLIFGSCSGSGSVGLIKFHRAAPHSQHSVMTTPLSPSYCHVRLFPPTPTPRCTQRESWASSHAATAAPS